MSNLFKHWKSLVGEYLDDKRTWEEITDADTKKAVEDIWDYAIAYASFACFIIGSIIGFIALT